MVPHEMETSSLGFTGHHATAGGLARASARIQDLPAALRANGRFAFLRHTGIKAGMILFKARQKLKPMHFLAMG